MMIEQRKRRENYYMRDTIKKEVGENATVDEVLQFLIGDDDGCCGGDYVVYKYSYSQKRSVINRLNLIWVFPLFLLSIPFSWMLTGDFGIKRNSKIGKIVEWLIKFD